ncbi:E4 [Human papillomavirus 169]|uniref:E4 n=1 Tax=Human papillomavirus 169 TaxID=1315260 RepID=K4MKS2_9PAPI|nr:E4 [Human papillomavirus 169]
MKMISGIRLREKWTTMDCILMKLMAPELILLCFLKMLIDMAAKMYGLLIMTMNKLFPLSLAQLGGLLLSPKRSVNLPPPSPHPKKKQTEEDRYTLRREDLARPRGFHPDDDEEEEENKENRPPVKDNDELLKVTESLISSLLQKLEQVIDLYQEQVSEELKGLKQKLKIRHS